MQVERLAGVGVIGLVSFTVRQKTKDIAIHMALGASNDCVLRLILRRFSWPVTVGVLAETGAVAAGSGILRRALYGISNLDAVGYAGAIGILLVILALHLNVAKALHYE